MSEQRELSIDHGWGGLDEGSADTALSSAVHQLDALAAYEAFADLAAEEGHELLVERG